MPCQCHPMPPAAGAALLNAGGSQREARCQHGVFRSFGACRRLKRPLQSPGRSLGMPKGAEDSWSCLTRHVRGHPGCPSPPAGDSVVTRGLMHCECPFQNQQGGGTACLIHPQAPTRARSRGAPRWDGDDSTGSPPTAHADSAPPGSSTNGSQRLN